MRRSCWVLALAALAACRTPGGTGNVASEPRPATPAGECAILSASRAAPESLTIAVTDPVRPGDAPVPRNPGERLVFAQLYAPLLRVDCRGRIVPAVARAWRADSGAHTWMVALRDDARFATGDPVPPGAIAGRDSSASADARSVLVFAADSGAAALRALADPARAPIRAAPDRSWPVGAGRYHVVTFDGRTLRLAARPGDPAPELVIHLIAPRTARDALDEGVDVLVTSDPEAIRYAASRPEYEPLPLAWDRSYVLMVPRAASAPAGSASGNDTAAASLRDALARDAVREEARASDGPHWWDGATSCAADPGDSLHRSLPGSTPASRIAYPERDAVAREIAERLVALAGVRAPNLAAVAPTVARAKPLLATGLAPEALSRALAAGSDVAYVMPLPALTLDPCRDTHALLGSAPWLADAQTPSPTALVPLVDTRARAIVRRGVVSLTTDWLGALTLDVPSRSAP